MSYGFQVFNASGQLVVDLSKELWVVVQTGVVNLGYGNYSQTIPVAGMAATGDWIVSIIQQNGAWWGGGWVGDEAYGPTITYNNGSFTINVFEGYLHNTSYYVFRKGA